MDLLYCILLVNALKDCTSRSTYSCSDTRKALEDFKRSYGPSGNVDALVLRIRVFGVHVDSERARVSVHAGRCFFEDRFGLCAHTLTSCKDGDGIFDATNSDWEISRWSRTRDASSCLEIYCRCAEVLVNHEAELFRQVEEAERLRHDGVQIVKLRLKNWKSGSCEDILKTQRVSKAIESTVGQ